MAEIVGMPRRKCRSHHFMLGVSKAGEASELYGHSGFCVEPVRWNHSSQVRCSLAVQSEIMGDQRRALATIVAKEWGMALVPETTRTTKRSSSEEAVYRTYAYPVPSCTLQSAGREQTACTSVYDFPRDCCCAPPHVRVRMTQSLAPHCHSQLRPPACTTDNP